MSSLTPEIGRWYQDRHSGQVFEIVARDAADSSVQVQYLDGEIADLDVECWAELALDPAAAPEDWRTGFTLDPDSARDPDATLQPALWSSPLTTIEPDMSFSAGADDD